MYDENIINEALDYTRHAVAVQIEELIQKKRSVKGAYGPLYDLLSDYPFRKGKTLRPAICIATARAAGGMAQQAMHSAAALEMYHNAFLIHDDVEDGSESRRGKNTLHELVGIPRAVNTGDATYLLALSFLLENLDTVGVSKAMHVMHEIENMARQSVEGQSMELDWVANHTFGLGDEDYYRMCTKKTCWYTFIAPLRIGYITGTPVWKEEDMIENLARLTQFGMMLGIAFQIQDDLLNLVGKLEKYGKEIAGDIYEGKRTIMLNHVIASSGQHSEAIKAIIRKPRSEKKKKDVNFILRQMDACGSIEYGRKLAEHFAAQALQMLEGLDFLREDTLIQPAEKWECGHMDKRLLRELVNYVVLRHL
ncbi:MAG: polyprenyl synthetase family protein [Saprospiraceae bacterium]|nr:polyprenyl synthetase family protein [Saprospiraceae bacterium]